MRVGIIGMGAIAPMHVNALLDCGHSIVALCDIEIERCKKIKADFSENEELARAEEYSDYKEMLDKAGLDSVHICTPHHLHAEMICEALSRNINVLCEKPLAISFEQFDMIERAVEQSSAQLGVSFQNRYNPTVLQMREFLKDKTVTSACASVIWKRDERYYASGAWRGKVATEGGGVMINQAIHSLDMLQYICGMPKTLIAHTSNNSLKGVIEVEDTAYGLFKIDDERNFVINATNAAKHSFSVDIKFYAEGHTVELFGENLIIDGEFKGKMDNTPAIGKHVWGLGHLPLVADFYDCVENGRKFPIDFYEAKKAISLVLRMYESNGKEIEV